MEEQPQQSESNEPIPKRPRPSVEDNVKNGSTTNNNEDDDESSLNLAEIPTFDFETMSSQDFLEAYTKYQAVLLKGAAPYLAGQGNKLQDPKDTPTITWKDIGFIYAALNASDKESWCIENLGENKERTLTAETILVPQLIQERAYCSFLVQKDKESYQRTLERLPVSRLGLNFDETWAYEPCLWIFFGRNKTTTTTKMNKNNGDKAPLEGRGLHTDSVSHDGTWHLQLSGVKDWYLSPSSELLCGNWKSLSEKERAKWNESTKVHVPCQEGDIIVVNTRLWFHRTVIPAQDNPSVSYARDFRLDRSNSTGDGGASGNENDNRHSDAATMTNLDGLYARNEIEAGTVIFTESDMPDCELHRSNDNPNCGVVELEDGTSAVVSCRAIASGEFFCVPESSDEEEGEECSYEEEAFDDDE